MKKIISLLLLLAICVSVFAGCKKDETPDVNNDTPGASVQSDLPSAVEYLTSMYKKGSKDEVMTLAKDLDLLSKVVVAGVSYDVSWAVSITAGPSDSVKIGESTQENHVLLDINETPEAEVQFTATATVKDAAGKTAAVSFKYKIVASATAGMTPEEIVDMAYALAEGEVMEGAATLTANIFKLKTPYDANFGNITIVIAVPGLEDKPIECYRLTGEKVSNDLCVGDTVTVTGILKNYNGTIEFDAGSNLDNVVSCGVVKPTDSKLIVDEAFALAAGDSLKYFSTLSGLVKSIDSEYSDQYKNVTITIEVEGTDGKKDLVCYRMKGDDAANVEVGDTVTVTGVIKNYVSSSSGESTVEFDAGCVLDKLVKGDGSTPDDEPDVPVEKPETEAEIVDAAYKLAEGKSLPYSATLTGKVVTVVDAYNSEFKNITVVIEVKGREKKPIECFRLTGKDVENIAVDDTITVTGTLKNFYGKIEFDFGCTLDKWVDGGKDPIKQETDPKKIIDAAYKLKEDADLGYDVTLTGKIIELNSPYESQYKSMTVTIAVAGRESKPIECFRMKGDKVSNKLCIGDTITVKGRLKNYKGTIEFDTGCTLEEYKSGGTKIPTDPKKIVDAAYALKEDASLKYFATLTGKVTKVNDAYDSTYKNISVTIAVDGYESKPIKCYRLKGDKVQEVAEGDTITVTGILKNFKGTIEFDSGCILDKWVDGGKDPIKQETDTKKIVDAAFALEKGKDLGYKATLTGKIVKLKTPYDPQYKNITVIIEVEGSNGKKELECFRMKGDKVSNKLCVGDTITVNGLLKNYNGTIEFDAGCTMEKYTSCGIKVPTDSKKIVDEAFKLEKNESLKYFVTLTGKVKEIVTPYDAQYKNLTVTIEVEGSDGTKVLECYRLKGEGADAIKVGDTITVTGIIKRYVNEEKGTDKIEFDAGCTFTK